MEALMVWPDLGWFVKRKRQRYLSKLSNKKIHVIRTLKNKSGLCRWALLFK